MYLPAIDARLGARTSYFTLLHFAAMELHLLQVTNSCVVSANTVQIHAMFAHHQTLNLAPDNVAVVGNKRPFKRPHPACA